MLQLRVVVDRVLVYTHALLEISGGPSEHTQFRAGVPSALVQGMALGRWHEGIGTGAVGNTGECRL